MAPPPSETTSPKTSRISPYGFGLNTFYLNFIPPLFYFLSKTLEAIFFPAQPFDSVAADKSNLLRPAPLNTCSLTEPEEPFIYIDHNWTKEAAQALLAFLFAIVLCGAARYSEAKLNRSSDKGRWAYYLEQLKRLTADSNDPIDRQRNAMTPDIVPSHNEYRISQRREATKLLFLVAISACLCPIAEFFLCARQAVSEQLYSQEGAVEWMGLLWRGLCTIYLVFRYGTHPCVLTGVTSDILTSIIFKRTEDDRAVGFWDRWIEKWIKAHQMENAEAVAKWVAEMKVIVAADGNLHIPSPEQNVRAQMYSK